MDWSDASLNVLPSGTLTDWLVILVHTSSMSGSIWVVIEDKSETGRRAEYQRWIMVGTAS